jgi:hypothetical protein
MKVIGDMSIQKHLFVVPMLSGARHCKTLSITDKAVSL